MQLFFVFLVALALVNASDGSTVQNPSEGVATKSSGQLLVWKNSLSKFSLADDDNVFEYLLVNKGNTELVDVLLDDRKSFPTDRFELRKGATMTKFDSIAPGANVSHHVIVVPIGPQPVINEEVVVFYTDSKSGNTTKTSFQMAFGGREYYFLSENAIGREVRSMKRGFKDFVGFFAISLLSTAVPAFLYYQSASRYSTTKKVQGKR